MARGSWPPAAAAAFPLPPAEPPGPAAGGGGVAAVGLVEAAPTELGADGGASEVAQAGESR